MKQNRTAATDYPPAWWWILVAIFILSAIALEELQAQEAPPTEEPPAALDLGVFLAATCVAEVSLRPGPGECFLMWEVNARNAKARGRTLEDQTRRFNMIWKYRPHRDRRPWIMELGRDLERPASWPEGWPWEEHRRSWERYLEAADLFLAHQEAGTWRPRCPRAIDYGASGDTPADPCAQLVICHPQALQRYWRRGKCESSPRSSKR